jgi:hypothetical protein
MNQTKIFSVLDEILHDAINSKLRYKFAKTLELISKTITDTKLLDIIKLQFNEQCYDVRTALKLSIVRKTRSKRTVDPKARCMARIGLGAQCSRSRIGNSEHCRSHQMSLPYGRCDIPEVPEKKLAKRRGRRSKNNKEYNISDLDMGKYVQAILIKIENKDSQENTSYLLDQNDVLYHFNGNNEIAGRLINNEHVEWYN